MTMAEIVTVPRSRPAASSSSSGPCRISAPRAYAREVPGLGRPALASLRHPHPERQDRPAPGRGAAPPTRAPRPCARTSTRAAAACSAPRPAPVPAAPAAPRPRGAAPRGRARRRAAPPPPAIPASPPRPARPGPLLGRHAAQQLQRPRPRRPAVEDAVRVAPRPRQLHRADHAAVAARVADLDHRPAQATPGCPASSSATTRAARTEAATARVLRPAGAPLATATRSAGWKVSTGAKRAPSLGCGSGSATGPPPAPASAPPCPAATFRSRLGCVDRPAPAAVLDRHHPRLLGRRRSAWACAACKVPNLSGAMVPSGPTRLTARHAAPVRRRRGRAGAARPRSARGLARRASRRARVHRHALAVVRHLHDPERAGGPADVVQRLRRACRTVSGIGTASALKTLTACQRSGSAWVPTSGPCSRPAPACSIS